MGRLENLFGPHHFTRSDRPQPFGGVFFGNFEPLIDSKRVKIFQAIEAG
jgi:hypothetical protein